MPSGISLNRDSDFAAQRGVAHNITELRAARLKACPDTSRDDAWVVFRRPSLTIEI
jgi:hypothetical protein